MIGTEDRRATRCTGLAAAQSLDNFPAKPDDVRIMKRRTPAGNAQRDGVR
jgi:hypothetical protein